MHDYRTTVRDRVSIKSIPRARFYRLASFLERLPPHKLDMSVVLDLKGSQKMDPYSCKSAACAMGWLPAVFPRYFKWRATPVVPEWEWGVVLKPGLLEDYDAAAKFFDIPFKHVLVVFGPGRKKYRTPEQVAKYIKQYADTGIVPKECYNKKYY
jgi:hypothetical protein